jgi:HTH-type transcriptional regulator, sugar sensing transcriptional regulator
LTRTQILKALTNFGLDVQEAAVYLAGCELGPVGAQKLAIKAEIKRGTCYDVLARLEEQGLFSTEHRGAKRLFRASPPESLANILDSRKEALSSLLPTLGSLYQNATDVESVRIIHGLPGTKQIYQEILASVRPGDQYMVISAGQPWHSLDPEYFQKFTEQRGEKSRRLGFNIRILQEDDAHARRQKERERAYNIQVKMFKKQMDLGINMVIVPKMLFIHQVKNPVKGFLLINPQIIRMHQQLFEILWAAF